ncbi:sensor histidine kinase [Nocardioides daejeonensis]|uniref:sensor histidine kinase n=1 Tax=Nocardioides daejeonensis TaxID=1046556 RepID=UPI000D74E51C|nr:ATP-binding protein [Nocardioides daejeonensis]
MTGAREPASRTWRLGAGALGASVLAACLASILIAPFNFRAEAGDYIHPEFFVLDLLLGLVYGPFGAYVALRSRQLAGWALALVGLGFALSGLGIQWTLLAAEGRVPGEALAASLAASAWLVGALSALLALPWLIVAGRSDSRLPLLAGRIGLGVAVAGGLVKFLEPAEGGPPEHAFAPHRVSSAASTADTWLVSLYLLLAVPGIVHLVRRMARSGGAERRALTWVLSSVVVLALSYVFFEIGLALGGTSLTAAAPTMFVAQMMLLAGTFALVVQDESWTVDLAISRSIVAALLGGLVVASYIVLVWLGGRALPLTDDAVSLISVVVVALGVTPLRTWVQRRVDDLVFGPGADIAHLLADLGRHLGTADSGEDLLTDLAAGLRSGLGLRRVELTALDPVTGDAGARVESGGPAPIALTLPLHSRGVEVGRLGLAAPLGRRLDPRTVRVTTQLSGLVAIAVELAGVNTVLEQTRRRLLEVRQEERRLLRRELHDGLGPSLSGVTLALAAIANTSTLRPADAALLEQVCVELNRRADDVRQMARVLLPPALEVGRLDEALQGLAARFTDDRFRVSVAVSGADRLPEQHQVAAYHIAAEGVRNAHRHAGARRCLVRLDVDDDGAAVLEVEDDGNGVDPQATPGIGLSSMRERAMELGGSFDLVSDDGGAKVTVVLP